jgi:hypothetical protein
MRRLRMVKARVTKEKREPVRATKVNRPEKEKAHRVKRRTHKMVNLPLCLLHQKMFNKN